MVKPPVFFALRWPLAGLLEGIERQLVNQEDERKDEKTSLFREGWRRSTPAIDKAARNPSESPLCWLTIGLDHEYF